ncbi:glycosyltransferase family 4 protein [Rhodonellum sp.]|uniref:glycosyltransferase family 4 protein n=1 Tax=Rhodonellum sp. TaxID=2231180 RepID=UPI0027161D60|nr:glycosyltransferase family 4 protein [Rhodonellum sp.]MDO9553106.1 glycosyltransferase family 4 protein [Rhodonellum sp.]
MKKILIAIPRFNIGGAETQGLYLANELKKRGYQVVIGAFGFETGEGYSRFIQSGLECIRWGFQEKIILTPQNGVAGCIRKYRYTLKLLLKVRSMNIDYIIPFTYPTNIIFCAWHQWMKVKKCVWNQRDNGIMFNGTRAEIQSLNNSSNIVSNSLDGLRFLELFTKSKIIHIPNGIDPNLFVPLKNGTKSKKVIMIGNIHGNKDHLTVIKAWKLVLVKFPDFQLIFVGENGSKFDESYALAKELGIQNSVDFKGLIKNIPGILSECCLAVFSSLNEGLPNAVLESMAAGLAVVASNIQGTKEALGNNYEFLVEPQNHMIFAESIIRLLGNEQLREKIGGENLLRVSSNFSIKSMVDRYENLLNG